MLSVDVLINAIAEEDQRLQKVITTCPLEYRDLSAPGEALGLKETLAHLTCWDEFTVEYFEALCNGRTPPPSFSEFVASSHDRMLSISKAAYQDVLEKYRTATHDLMGLLRSHWQGMTEEQHNNLFLPLRHRRHHRRLLAKYFESLSPSLVEEGLADATG